MPHGCFEQTTSITYPNVLTLDYMKKTKQVSPELQMKAEGFVSAGYQRLLTFETSTPGGFSLYGRQPPVLLLTAYGLMELSDMSSVYNVDAGLLERMRMWLSSQQDKDGSWGGGLASFILEGEWLIQDLHQHVLYLGALPEVRTQVYKGLKSI